MKLYQYIVESTEDPHKKLENTVMRYLSSNLNPNENSLKDWAKSNNLNWEQIELIIFKIAAKHSKFLLVDGEQFDKKLNVNKLDINQIKKGIDVEKEHTSDENIARKIALDHLALHPNYFDYLEKMINSLGNEQVEEKPEEDQPQNDELKEKFGKNHPDNKSESKFSSRFSKDKSEDKKQDPEKKI